MPTPLTPTALLETSVLKARASQHLVETTLRYLHYVKSLIPETKIAEFANNVDLDEVAHHEPPHLDLHCLPSSL